MAVFDPRTAQVGDSLPDWQVTAVNDAADSNNPMHNDEFARAQGYRGALVPGVTVFGYLMHPLVEAFGVEFLSRGGVEVRFRRPVYAKDKVSVRANLATVQGDVKCVQLEVVNPEGETCAIATAEFPLAVEARPSPAAVPLDGTRRPATAEALRAAPVLGAFQDAYDEARRDAYLQVLGESLPCFRDIVHPAWLLRQANYLVDRNIAVKAWIHVASRIQMLRTVPIGRPYVTKGQVVELYERKGNEYFDLDVVIECDDAPVMRIVHSAIYRLAGA